MNVNTQEMLLAQIESKKAAKPSELCDGHPFCCAAHAQKHRDWLDSFGENSSVRGDDWWWRDRDKADAIILAARSHPTAAQSARKKLMDQVATGKP